MKFADLLKVVPENQLMIISRRKYTITGSPIVLASWIVKPVLDASVIELKSFDNKLCVWLEDVDE